MSSRPKANSNVEHSAAGAVDADGIATTSGTSSHGGAAGRSGSKRQRRQRRKAATPDPAVFAPPSAVTTARVDPATAKKEAKKSNKATTRPRDERDTQPLRPASEVLAASRKRRRHGVSTLDFLPSLTTFFVLAHFAAVAVLLYLFVL